MAQNISIPASPPSLGQLVLYFLKLGTIGFGGPAALVGYMRKDLVDDGKRIDETTYNLSLALGQIMPGPLAAQTAIAIGYFQGGVLGATLVGFAFIVPSFFMVLVLSWLYVAYGGLPWMQAIFYGIGAVVIAIIAIAAYRLARGTNKSDPLLWGICGVLLAATVWSQTELAALFILAGLLVVYVRAWPGLRAGLLMTAAGALLILGIWGIGTFLLGAHAMVGHGSILAQILLFFTKAGTFVFGSGLAIVPFLEKGLVHELGWLNAHQFLDAVAVAMITPGPVVITVAFVGYLVAGTAGAIAAAIGIFLPVYIFTRLARLRIRMGATISTKRNDGRKMPTVATSDPQNPATRAPTNVAVMTTGPGHDGAGHGAASRPRHAAVLTNTARGKQTWQSRNHIRHRLRDPPRASPRASRSGTWWPLS